MNRDVFISYSSDDKIIAFELCYLLELNGLKCWIAPRDIDPIKEYANEIMKGIRASKMVVFVMSENSMSSEYVLQEIIGMDEYQKDILPFKIDEADPTDDFGYYVNSKQWIEAFPNPVDKYGLLIRTAIKICRGTGGGDVNLSLEGFNPNDIMKLKRDYVSLILLFTPLYWASFLYMGTVANVRLWRISGLIYLIPSIVCVIFYFQIWGILFLFYPIFAMFLGLFFIFWILAIAHGLLIRNDFLTKKSILRLLSSNKDFYAGLVEHYSKF